MFEAEFLAKAQAGSTHVHTDDQEGGKLVHSLGFKSFMFSV